jgi:hypothetical protein
LIIYRIQQRGIVLIIDGIGRTHTIRRVLAIYGIGRAHTIQHSTQSKG